MTWWLARISVYPCRRTACEWQITCTGSAATCGDRRMTPVTLSERRRATLRRDLQAILDGIHQEDYPARPDPRVCATCPFLLICPS